MQNIIDLNSEIEKIAQPEIEFHQKFQNIRFDGNWVNELNYNHFEDWEKRIKDKINKIVDLESPSKVKFIKVFQQDVLQKYNDLLKVDYDNLETLKSIPRIIFMTDSIIKPPKTKVSEFYFSGDIMDGFEEILLKMAEIYKIESFDYYDGDNHPDSQKDILQDEILHRLNIEDNQLDTIYSYVFLCFALKSTTKLLGGITKYLDYLVNLINKIENFEEDKLTLDEVYDNDPNNLKLEFKINKINVALFYRVFHDLGIFEVDNKNQKHPYSNLKNYINGSNMYYLENHKVEKIKNINKEFAKFLNDNKYEKHEINLIELLISKLKSRKEEIEANSEEGLL
ncbi:hypothetical protein SAMN03097699_0607 [Flavobacteriaceae bacterium MAR_2010_188]|nr:hypothetical protein SAMN03097699_0607 [Flavobacteriaceae bacterium MAR_2010_188]